MRDTPQLSEKGKIIDGYQRAMASSLIGENFDQIRMDFEKIENLISPSLFSFFCKSYNAALNSFEKHHPETFGDGPASDVQGDA